MKQVSYFLEVRLIYYEFSKKNLFLKLITDYQKRKINSAVTRGSTRACHMACHWVSPG
jgi:hypothetical protein